LENLLRSLAPAAVSPDLRNRVEEELRLDMSWLSQTVKKPRAVRWLAPVTYAAMGAAAAIVVMSTFSSSITPPASVSKPGVASATAPASGVMPISTIAEWDDVQDEGIRYTADRLPQKHVRVRGTERHLYIDPRDGAEIIVEYPREQSLVLPVNFQ
ncbi:MAG: hypothetical protein RIS79_875, partial [Verrucomicrobiota bacterium]